MTREIWRPVPGYASLYEASNLGRVRSLDRTVRYVTGRIDIRFGRILKSAPNSKGYQCVGLSKSGKSKTIGVAHIVALTFLGPRPKGMYVCHNNGDKTKNRLSNLRYDTPENNQADRLAHGTHAKGERHHNARLTPDNVATIRKLAGCKAQKEIAAMFGVTRSCVSKIIVRKIWTHI